MLQNVKIHHDGSHYVATIPGTSLCPKDGPRCRKAFDTQKDIFDFFYTEAKQKSISPKKRCRYIASRIQDICDVGYWTTDEEAEGLYKRCVRNEHKRTRRYLQKLYLNEWNYFVTFTYDDKKETPEGFRERLRKALSNLHSRNNWSVISCWEEGELSGRLHLHAFLNVPEGGMVGELFLDKKYSTKRHKWEYFTNNTYFQKRFGQTDWRSIDRNDLKKGLAAYLIKYLKKSNSKLIYSRGIPSDVDLMIDPETDVCTMYRDGSLKYVLFDSVIYRKEAESALLITENMLVITPEEQAEYERELTGLTRRMIPGIEINLTA